jgi:multicomponent Na+:H+ antiporter subunit D
VIVFVALLVSLLTLFSMMKIWSAAFWRSPPETLPAPRNYSLLERLGHLAPIFALTMMTVVIGLSAETIYTLAQAAAVQLLNPAQYIAAVLGS